MVTVIEIVLVEVGPTDTEQGTRVSRTVETVRKACANQMTTVCIDAMTRKPVSGIATDSSGAKAE